MVSSIQVNRQQHSSTAFSDILKEFNKEQHGDHRVRLRSDNRTLYVRGNSGVVRNMATAIKDLLVGEARRAEGLTTIKEAIDAEYGAGTADTAFKALGWGDEKSSITASELNELNTSIQDGIHVVNNIKGRMDFLTKMVIKEQPSMGKVLDGINDIISHPVLLSSVASHVDLATESLNKGWGPADSDSPDAQRFQVFRNIAKESVQSLSLNQLIRLNVHLGQMAPLQSMVHLRPMAHVLAEFSAEEQAKNAELGMTYESSKAILQRNQALMLGEFCAAFAMAVVDQMKEEVRDGNINESAFGPPCDVLRQEVNIPDLGDDPDIRAFFSSLKPLGIDRENLLGAVLEPSKQAQEDNNLQDLFKS